MIGHGGGSFASRFWASLQLIIPGRVVIIGVALTFAFALYGLAVFWDTFAFGSGRHSFFDGTIYMSRRDSWQYANWIVGAALLIYFYAFLKAAFLKWRHILFSITQILFLVGVGLLLSEFIFRLYQGEPVTRLHNYREARLAFTGEGSSSVYDEVLGWRLSDSIRSIVEGRVDFVTGLHGIRSWGEIDFKVVPGQAIAVGDSFTAGSGVRDAETWPAQLMVKLGVTIYNGAAGAWAFDQIVLRTEQLVEILKPRLALVSILTDDVQRNAYERYGGGTKPYFQLTNDGGIELRNVPVPRTGTTTVEPSLWLRVLGHSFLADWFAMHSGFGPEWVNTALRYRRVYDEAVATEVACRLTDRLVALRDREKIRLVFIIQYGAHEVMSGQRLKHSSKVIDCARGRGLEVVDTFEPLQQVFLVQGKAEFARLFIDEGGILGHMSVAGNEFVADLLAGYLRPEPYVAPPAIPVHRGEQFEPAR